MIRYRQNYVALKHVPVPATALIEGTELPELRERRFRAWRPVIAREPHDATLRLVHQIRIAATLTGTSTTRIGREAVGDPRLYSDLVRGRELRERTREKVQAYLRNLVSQHREASHG